MGAWTDAEGFRHDEDVDDHARAHRRIITWHAYPPIPVRCCDWAAYRDGDEEKGCYGWGATEEEAITTLLTQEEEDAA